jgi:hypothetical protein
MAPWRGLSTPRAEIPKSKTNKIKTKSDDATCKIYETSIIPEHVVSTLKKNYVKQN